MSYEQVPGSLPDYSQGEAVLASATPQVVSAIEQRLTRERQARPVATVADHDLKKPFYSHIDDEILDKNDRRAALASLQTMDKLISNILEHPQEDKYRHFKLSNTTIKNKIEGIIGAHAFLVKAGFRREVVQFEECLAFPLNPSPTQLHKLQLAHECLQVKVSILLSEFERKDKAQASEKELEEARKQRALLAFQEDRRSKKEKDEREKVIREAVAKEKENDEESASSTSHTVPKKKPVTIQDCHTVPYPVPGCSGGC